MKKDKTYNFGDRKMRVDLHLLLEDISKRQNLGLLPQEMPLIIETTITTFRMALLFHEDEEYVSIVVPDGTGAEFAKILKKDTICSVEVVYAQMLQNQEKGKGEVMYV